MKRIAILTGKLGGYQSLRPLAHKIQAHPELELTWLIADQHNDKKFGDTEDLICKEFPKAERLHIVYQDASNRVSDAASMLYDLDELKADMLVVLGDRLETLCGALAALELGIPIAHVQAGDVSGGLDEKRRRAISQMSDLLFCSTLMAQQRLIYQGIPKEKTHVVGDPHIDAIIAGDYDKNYAAWFRSAYPKQKIILLHLHPDTCNPKASGELARETLAALRTLFPESFIIAVYPCSDQGHEAIIEELEANKGLFWGVYPALPPRRWHALMSIADCIVGNSSAGLIEAPYFGLPAINIGDRQHGRDGLEYAVNVPPERAAIEQALLAPPTRADLFRIFGDGTANEQIFSCLLRSLDVE